MILQVALAPPQEAVAAGQPRLHGKHVWPKGSDQKCRHVGGEATGFGGLCCSDAGDMHREKRDMAAPIRKGLAPHGGRNFRRYRTTYQTLPLLLPAPSGCPSVQIWLKAWTVPHTPRPTQTQGLLPTSQMPETESSALPEGTPWSWAFIVLFCTGHPLYSFVVVTKQLGKKVFF